MIENTGFTDKQQKRYNRILKQSYELFLNQGFSKISLSNLTKELRISRSTIYDNFGSKEGLVEKVVERFNEKLEFGLMEIMKNKSLSTYDRFLAISKQLVLNSPSRNTYQFYNDLKIHLPDVYEQHLKERNKRVELIYKPLIKEGLNTEILDNKLPMEFLLQSYLKSTQMVCETDMLSYSALSKLEAMKITTTIFLNGAKKVI